MTEIAEVQDDEILIRGYKLTELIGQVTFVDMTFLTLTGAFPTLEKRQVLEAMLVSVVEHGISPSTIITRTLASCGTPIQAAIAGGVLSIGDWYGGAGEQLARLLDRVVSQTPPLPPKDWEATVALKMSKVVQEYRVENRNIDGFGHPQHPDEDRRATILLKLAERLGVAGRHTAALQLLGIELSLALNRRMPPNVIGAFASLALDLGFPWQAVRGFVIAPRVIGLTAHAIEENKQGGRWRHSKSVSYLGPRARTLEVPPQ